MPCVDVDAADPKLKAFAEQYIKHFVGRGAGWELYVRFGESLRDSGCRQVLQNSY